MAATVTPTEAVAPAAERIAEPVAMVMATGLRSLAVENGVTAPVGTDGMLRGPRTVDLLQPPPPETVNRLQKVIWRVQPLVRLHVEKPSVDAPLGIGIWTHSQSHWTCVNKVEPEGLAAKAGIRVGDRIYIVGGVTILDANDATERMKAAPAGTLEVGLTHQLVNGTYDWWCDRYRYAAGFVMVCACFCFMNPVGAFIAFRIGRGILFGTENNAELAKDISNIRWRIRIFQIVTTIYALCAWGLVGYLCSISIFGTSVFIDNNPLVFLLLMGPCSAFQNCLQAFVWQMLESMTKVDGFRDPKTGKFPDEDDEQPHVDPEA